MDKPYIIIHTHTSIDGNIDIMDLFEFQEASRQYQELAINPEKQQFGIQGYLNGKTTTEDNMTHYKEPKLEKNAPLVPEGDYINNPDAPMYYLSIDARGELAFEENYSSYGGVNSHIVEVLTEQASNAYKHFLREKEISYIIAGKKEIDYEVMLDKFYHLFGIQKMMVGGGGTLNWSFIQNGLADEVSMILAPIANADPEGHRFFVAKEPYSTIQETAFQLKAVEELEHGTLWIRYAVKNDGEK
ncbi:MAG TPA: dihydrofolate reductase family protein [Candidatus Atopostipes pullistercoris]|uniref:Dihydrofolate reductase family protein n=1 Tax=Candidatus Atopostipes pullistercoris TaxID=2838467 RepID=A0A9D2G0W7_9LACT|nr:dihydrofolate reductase family protein [Candidatus Atopostipes pullistercoris]